MMLFHIGVGLVGLAALAALHKADTPRQSAVEPPPILLDTTTVTDPHKDLPTPWFVNATPIPPPPGAIDPNNLPTPGPWYIPPPYEWGYPRD